MRLEISHAGPVACPRCATVWESPDRRYYRNCPKCQDKKRADAGEWMNGIGVPEDYWDLTDFDLLEG